MQASVFARWAAPGTSTPRSVDNGYGQIGQPFLHAFIEPGDRLRALALVETDFVTCSGRVMFTGYRPIRVATARPYARSRHDRRIRHHVVMLQEGAHAGPHGARR